MAIPSKVRKFLIENKGKDKCEVIEGMMVKFRHKQITALGYYSKFNSTENKNARERTFELLRKNKNAINNSNKENAEKLGISVNLYYSYKWQYKNLYKSEDLKNREYEKYYKGRLREKFKFDDSRL